MKKKHSCLLKKLMLPSRWHLILAPPREEKNQDCIIRPSMGPVAGRGTRMILIIDRCQTPALAGDYSVHALVHFELLKNIRDWVLYTEEKFI